MMRVLVLLAALLGSNLAQESCTTAGDLICSSDCADIQLCMTNADGSFNPFTVETCATDLFCYSNKKACISINTCDPSNLPAFECPGPNVFPDPYDCTKYHICTGAPPYIDNVINCAAGTVYDSVDKRCTLQAADDPPQCTDNGVPHCRRLGETVVYKYNSQLYFICKSMTGQTDVLYPALLSCNGDEEFSGGSCKPPQ